MLNVSLSEGGYLHQQLDGLVELLEGFVVVARIEHKAVVREHDTLGIAESTVVVDIAFSPTASLFIRQLAFVVIELAATDALAGKNVP